MNSMMFRPEKLHRYIQVCISLWIALAFLLGSVTPGGAGGISQGSASLLSNGDDFEEAVKALADQPLDSTPLRLRKMALETLTPVAVANGHGGQEALPLELVNRIAEDSAAYFFDEGRITQAEVIAHDRELIQQLVKLLKNKQVPAD